MTAKTIPILPSSDFDRTSGFFSGLGFAEGGRWPGEYLVMAHSAGIEIHFWHKPDVDCRTNEVACYVRFETDAQAQALYAAWTRGLREGGRLHAPTTTDYGLLEFALVDPDGNLLRVGGRLPSQ